MCHNKEYLNKKSNKNIIKKSLHLLYNNKLKTEK